MRRRCNEGGIWDASASLREPPIFEPGISQAILIPSPTKSLNQYFIAADFFNFPKKNSANTLIFNYFCDCFAENKIFSVQQRNCLLINSYSDDNRKKTCLHFWKQAGRW